MAILSAVSRRQPSQRALKACVYALLSLGALAILYPLLIVLGQTVSDKFDLRDNAIVPAYLYDRDELALKYVFAQYSSLEFLASVHKRPAWSNQMQMRADSSFYASRSDAFAKEGLSLANAAPAIADLHAFIAQEPAWALVPRAFRVNDYYRPFLRARYEAKALALQKEIAQGAQSPSWLLQSAPASERALKSLLADPARLGVAIMNRELRGDYLNFDSVELRNQGNFSMPFWRPGEEPKDLLWLDFAASLPPEAKMLVPSDYYWHCFLRLKYRSVASLNAAWGAKLSGFQELSAPLALPANPAEAKDWREFVVKRWPRNLLELPAGAAPLWREHLRKALLAGSSGDEAKALAEAARLTGRPLRSWSEVEVPARRPSGEALNRYWCAFTSSGAVPAEAFKLNAPEERFRSFLKERYGGGQGALAALNAAWGSSFASFEKIPLPCALEDVAAVAERPGKLRWLFMTDSYRRVLEMLRGRGHAIRNTVILVSLSLLAALTINPIAAYSLSRFPMKSSQKVLLFLLATMAFPAEVAMIPNFLLLRDMGLLNTYAALIVPGIANGFAIFLLKGFFDSLPQELFEAAELDGASELQIFRLVAMPLIKPILAYVGLGAFIASYSGFMWAFVICPKQEMWTLMVWVYDFQMRSPGNNFVMAATALVSIPPLLVFLFANRIIMQGIVIPSMK